MDETATVAIVGAGPLGLELAIALKAVSISFLLFDRGQVGQMIYNFPRDTRFFSSSERISIAGMPVQTKDQQKCSREEYLAYLRTLVMGHQLKVNSYEEVVLIEKLPSQEFKIKTQSSKGEHFYKVQYVVLASGGTSRPCLLNVPGENLPHVSIKMDDPHRYFMKKLVVIGGKNSAAETALRCFQAGAHVTVVHRNESLNEASIKYWLMPEIRGRLERGEISSYFNTEVKAIHPDSLILENKHSHEKIEIPADFVIKTIGFEADMHLFSQVGAELFGVEQRPVFNKETMETTASGVYVLGTVIGGTQKSYRVFIENTHIHVEKIVRTLLVNLGLSLDPLKSIPWLQECFRAKELEE